MATDLSSVLHALPQLSPTDLQKVIGKAKLALALDGKGVVVEEPPEEAPTEDFILEGIHRELRRRGLLGRAGRIHKRKIPQSYVQTSYQVRRYLGESLPNLRAIERVALGQLAARCLADWLEVRGKQVTVSSLLYRVSDIPSALDYCFPGYLQAGLLSFCWCDR
jgi:hypothetical protein